MNEEMLREKKEKLARPGQILRSIRKAQGLNQKTTAKWCKIHPARYNRIENGKVNVYAYEWLEIIEQLEHEIVVTSSNHVVKPPKPDQP